MEMSWLACRGIRRNRHGRPRPEPQPRPPRAARTVESGRSPGSRATCGITARAGRRLPMPAHSGFEVVRRSTRLPLRGQRRPCRMDLRRTGFPFHPGKLCTDTRNRSSLSSRPMRRGGSVGEGRGAILPPRAHDALTPYWKQAGPGRVPSRGVRSRVAGRRPRAEKVAKLQPSDGVHTFRGRREAPETPERKVDNPHGTSLCSRQVKSALGIRVQASTGS